MLSSQHSPDYYFSVKQEIIKMKRRSLLNNCFSNQYIQLDPGKCKACWACIENCPQNALGKIEFFTHRHTRIKNPAKCTGCLKCASICKFNSISPVQENRITATPVNNEIYRRHGHAWWDDDAGEFSTIRFFVNPVRFKYFRRVIVPGAQRLLSWT